MAAKGIVMNMMQPDGIFGALKAGCCVANSRRGVRALGQRFAGIRRQSTALLRRYRGWNQRGGWLADVVASDTPRRSMDAAEVGDFVEAYRLLDQHASELKRPLEMAPEVVP